MSLVRRNVIANFAGRIWTALVNLAFIPLYVQYLGMEAYGLIGFHATMAAMFSLLDLGLSSTINREIARWAARPSDGQEVRNLVRTLETIYWVAALWIAVLVVALAPLIAGRWVDARDLPADTVAHAVRMMGLSIALQWPSALYAGGIEGLQHQVFLNGVQIAGLTLRNGGVVLALAWLSPTLTIFFGWTAAVNALMTLVLRESLWRMLPVTGRSALFDRGVVRRVWRFAGGMSGIAILSFILMQMDRLVLSKMLSLEQFGYYTLAVTVASTLLQVVRPFTSAFFPQLVQAAAVPGDRSLALLYHRSCQVVSVAVVPVAITLAVFSRELLLVWTGEERVASQVAQPLALLSVGYGLLALMNMPYLLQLASGWLQLAFWQNVLSVVVLLPLLLWAVRSYGATGAAMVWLLLNIGYVLIAVPLMHRRLLPGEAGEWYLHDTGAPICVALLVVLGSSVSVHGQTARSVLLLTIGGIWLIATLAAGLAAPQMRAMLLGRAGRGARAGL
ncbi:MAG: oligosaccharide flippase family protein [Chloroherpetonaceae bacterium]|nr:oligosaccharide flippase family protein [Chthonomonadaceae bacterium]MDW8208273.1 oligosaccharide flippase family protein [Chloroherpetonaceae bacterium]